MRAAANVALQRPALQNSTFGSAVASLAVDNNLTTSSCTDTTVQPWWSVDLGRPMDVGRVCVTNNDSPQYGQPCNRAHGCDSICDCMDNINCCLVVLK